MRIEKLSSSPDRAGRYRTELSNGIVLRLYRQTVEDFGIFAGLELTDAELSKLQIAAGEMSAKMRAVRILSVSSVSKGDLERRLIQKGEDPDQAKAAVDWMCELSLIDDRKTAEQVVYRCISKGYGIQRARQALYEKRIPREFWEEALAEYPDQSQFIMEFLDAHLTANSDRKDIKRAVDALIRRGHSYGNIRRVLDDLMIEFHEFSED